MMMMFQEICPAGVVEDTSAAEGGRAAAGAERDGVGSEAACLFVLLSSPLGSARVPVLSVGQCAGGTRWVNAGVPILWHVWAQRV
jgi:hypothetical protein